MVIIDLLLGCFQGVSRYASVEDFSFHSTGQDPVRAMSGVIWLCAMTVWFATSLVGCAQIAESEITEGKVFVSVG